MPNIRAYRGFSNEDLAKELIKLNTRRDAIYDSQSVGTQSYQKNLDRIDRQFAAAMEVWQERGGQGIPQSPTDVPGSGRKQSQNGGTNYRDVRIS